LRHESASGHPVERPVLPALAAWQWRTKVVLWWSATMFGLYAVQRVVFGTEGRSPITFIDWVLASLVVLWILPGVTAIPGLVGLLWHRPRDTSNAPVIDTLVCWRIVSRGTNREALRKTVEAVQREMANTPHFPYVIEVVTDESVGLPDTDDVRHLVVPKDYVTPNRSKFKARALNYAVEKSPLPEDAWIVHLDEETHPTFCVIEGIALMIQEEEVSGEHRIGQGCILYHRDWGKHPFLTLADMMRTGDDMARFYLQYRLGRTLFGMHGSFIVVRNSVAKKVGFDFGPRGSITEDAFWALVQMSHGRRARWVDGNMEEQSTQSVKDFVKQRRRWFVGLILVARYAPAPFRYRASVAVSTLIWALSPLGLTFTLSQVFLGFDVHPVLHFLANAAYSSFVVLYFIGLHINLDGHGIRNWHKRVQWFVLTALLLPLFSLIEAAGVVYGMVRPDVGGFHVVKK
jgi:egghead protein (zeste-white 4 protein)